MAVLRMPITMLVCAACWLLAGQAQGGEALGARYPALSPDGKAVVFSYWGDLWVAPVDGSASARRLTDHLAMDSHPCYSPDGSRIAFVSRRSGNEDVWVMPADGGEARQLTYHSGDDSLDGWTGDGSTVVFHARRGLWSSDIYVLDTAGDGPPEQITRLDHYNSLQGVKLPDGGWLYTRGAGRWARKGYRGTAQYDLWRMMPDGSHVRLTEHRGNDHWPMLAPDGDSVFYVTDEDGIDNIWCLSLADGGRRQVTHHATDGVQWPRIQPASWQIVYEFDGGLYILDAKEQASRELALNLATEGKDNWVALRSFNDEASEYAVSPHGKYAVFVHRGDLWAVKDPSAYDDEEPDQDLSRAWRLTASDDARERSPVFAPDNRHVAYATDADGDYEIWMLDLLDMSHRQLTNNGWDDLEPRFDPSNNDVLFFWSGNRSLQRLDLVSGEARTVVEGPFRGGFGYADYAVSPDGRWVAYPMEMRDWATEIWVASATGEQQPVNVTRTQYSESDPRWSADGRYLAYRSRDEDTGSVHAVELDPAPAVYDLEFLLAEDHPDGAADDDSVPTGEDEEGEKPEDGELESDAEKEESEAEDAQAGQDEVEVRIDFEDIHLRARRLAAHRRVGALVIDRKGEWVIYEATSDTGDTGLWVASVEDGEQQKLRDGGWAEPVLAGKGKRIYHLDGGAIRYFSYGDGKLKDRETLTAHGRYVLDKRVQWRQMYREAWSVLKQRFYDSEMHGVDWDAVYEKYLPYMDSIGTPEEMALVMTELLGELNASHLGFTAAESSFDYEGTQTCQLGLEFDPEYDDEGLRISHITYRGPADQPGVELAVGDVLLSVAGEPVGSDRRWEQALDNLEGQPVRLLVSDETAESSGHEVVLKPISYTAYQRLLYREWEIANEETVSKLSGGRLGYIHIRSMGRSELRKFERELVAELIDKDGLIVDVRFNSGGFIHEDLYELLDRQLYGYSQPRDEPAVLRPARAFAKPKALLINARSYSDAEIFPSGWRQLGLGPVIGIDTGGAVIGTSGFTLVDGSWVRLPMNGWFELDGRNLELSGTPPDVYVDVDPDELLAGYDAQLHQAVDLLLAELDG